MSAGAATGIVMNSTATVAARLVVPAILVIGAALGWPATSPAAPLSLADQPVTAKLSQPANVMFDLSVEWPTGNVQAHNDEISGTGCPGRDAGFSVCYFAPAVRAARVNAAHAANPLYTPQVSMPYLGYFDPFKCYQYDSAGGYFTPVGYTSGFSPARHYSSQPASSDATCAGRWSGNFLNWSTTQTIDIFRWAMTGGDRRIDTTTTTVLQKARHDGKGAAAQFPVKRIGLGFGDVPVTAPTAVSPYGASTLYIQVHGQGTAMRVSATSDFAAAEVFEVSVKVCDPAFPESATTCTAYGSALKPTGIIQENAEQVRFGAFGYLLDPNKARDGGVLRARMKFVGPQRPTLTAGGLATNDVAEWRATDGTFIENPNPADAAATTALSPATPVVRSGLIQYLNKFGRTAGYKSYDPLAEMYYESLRYFKNLPPTPEYTDFGLTPGTAGDKIDDFPVITSWDDPLAPPAGFENAIEWCPKNFIIAISDSNTHDDKRLPGNSDTTGEAAATPSNPDPAMNVSALLGEIIATELANEGVTLLAAGGSPLAPGVANGAGLGGSAYPAALAYHANTRDIRPDGAAIQTRGKQTVRTFMVDVREANSWGTGVDRSNPKRRNQLWLTGKYGGFVDQDGDEHLGTGDALADVNGDGNIDILDVWDGNADLLPDNYFEAGSSEALVEGLKGAFATIQSEISSNASVAVAMRSVELQAGTGLYQVNYDQGFWSGDLVAYDYSDFDRSSGLVSAARVWSAAEKLEAADWSARRIATSLRGSASGSWAGAAPFRWSNLTPWQQSRLKDNPAILDFLRGRADNPAFRRRLRSPGSGMALVAAKLGDIVDSAPRYVARPGAPLSDQYNPGYRTFADGWKNRRPVIYVGANDGMMHAFDARIDHADGGSELFAYVPSPLFDGVTAPAVDGLLALSNRSYVHRYFVNATPAAADVDFARTSGATTTGDWHTVLVGGLGKGGRAYYAIDVTDPAAFSSETAVASKVLWEFTHPTMGFSYGEPQIVKTRRWGWVALLTSGYNNIASNGSTGAGGGYLYVVDIKTGTLLQMIATGSGSDAAPSGLAQVTAYVPDTADGTVTEVYGGDMHGKVWRFDFTSATAHVPTPVHFATLDGPGAPGGPQAITTGPIIRSAPISRKRYVFVGTGSLLGQPDIFTSGQQTFYALRDGTRIARSASGVGDAPTFPINRSKMIANANLLDPIVANPARTGGWYHDLKTGAERVIIDPQDTDLGRISWLGTVPNATLLCTGENRSRLYLANFETGQSQLYDPASIASGPLVRITSFDPGTTAVGLRLVRVGGNLRALITGSDQSLSLTQAYLRLLSPRTMNWREVTEPGH